MAIVYLCWVRRAVSTTVVKEDTVRRTSGHEEDDKTEMSELPKSLVPER